FVSVNIAAVIPIVSQLASHAADGAVSDKTQWLKENLASMGERKAVKLKAQTASLAESLPKSSDLPEGLTTTKQLTRLRPFMANRKLASQKELEQSLVAQTPQLAGQPSSQLNGKISTFYNSNTPDCTNRAVLQSKPAASSGMDFKRASQFVNKY